MTKILSHSISQELYIIWSSFVIHKNKMISSNIFFIFPKFWFFGLLGGSKVFQILIFRVNPGARGQKMSQNDKKLCLSHPYIRKHTSYDRDFWYTCVKWWHIQILFSFFQNFQFVGYYGRGGRGSRRGGSKGKKQ